MSNILEFRQVMDGVVCYGLKPGIYQVAGDVHHEFMQMSLDGGFWPYKAVIIGCDFPKDLYLIRIEEIP